MIAFKISRELRQKLKVTEKMVFDSKTHEPVIDPSTTRPVKSKNVDQDAFHSLCNDELLADDKFLAGGWKDRFDLETQQLHRHMNWLQAHLLAEQAETGAIMVRNADGSSVSGADGLGMTVDLKEGDSPLAMLETLGLKLTWDALEKYGQDNMPAVQQTRTGFFATLPWAPGGQALWNAIKQIQPTPTILTGVPRGTWAQPQKEQWCREKLLTDQEKREGKVVNMITCNSSQKPQAAQAKPGDILIDDSERLQQNWQDVCGDRNFIWHQSATLGGIRATAKTVLTLVERGLLSPRVLKCTIAELREEVDMRGTLDQADLDYLSGMDSELSAYMRMNPS